MKIVQNIFKIEEKFSDVPKKFGVSPPKSRVCRVSGNETFFGGLKTVFQMSRSGKMCLWFQ